MWDSWNRRTAAVEWPDTHCKLIDIGNVTGIEAAHLLSEEICFGGCDIDVALWEEKRFTLALDYQQPVYQTAPYLHSDDVIVVSGGARGVTASCVIGMAKQAPASFFLLGRTQLLPDPCPAAKTDAEVKRALLTDHKGITPKELRKKTKDIFACREIQQTLAAISATGADATYHSVDVCDVQRVKHVIDKIREQKGSITGLIHGAGVLADKKIADKSIEDFSWVYAVKIDGLHALLDAIEEDRLRLLCFFSSVAARSGNHGQSDYAAANEVLNKIALDYAHNHPDCLVKSLGWGPWDGGMVSPALKAHFQKQGVAVIPVDGGVDAMALELQEENDVELVLGHALLPQKMETEYSVLLDPIGYDFLRDHAINGDVVVPMALVLSFFRSAVSSFAPQWNSFGLHNIQVLRGINLKDFGKAELFVIRLQRIGEEISLRWTQGEVSFYHATARAETASHDIPSLHVEDDIEEIYRGPLFHGKHFHVLQTVQQPSKEGATASLKTDLSMIQQLDASLQLALLWTEKQTQAHSIPMKIAKVVWGSGTATSCRLVGKKVSNHRACSDAFLLNDAGDLSCALLGVETFLRPNS